MNAKPMQAAVASAATFAVGAILPLLVTYFAPESNIANYVGATSLVFLAALGGLAAKAGGANITVGIARVAFWGVIAMAATAGVGKLFGVVTA
jgi:VIT1/CCC1 family predicted Fe2+/Mn2+ transporter